MKHMIKWLKICAMLLTVLIAISIIQLAVHSIEIGYDLMYHTDGRP